MSEFSKADFQSAVRAYGDRSLKLLVVDMHGANQLPAYEDRPVEEKSADFLADYIYPSSHDDVTKVRNSLDTIRYNASLTKDEELQGRLKSCDKLLAEHAERFPLAAQERRDAVKYPTYWRQADNKSLTSNGTLTGDFDAPVPNTEMDVDDTAPPSLPGGSEAHDMRSMSFSELVQEFDQQLQAKDDTIRELTAKNEQLTGRVQTLSDANDHLRTLSGLDEDSGGHC